MQKIKVLEANNIDLIGNRFNGYDMIEDLSDNKLQIKQVVIDKLSDNENVYRLITNNSLRECFNKFEGVEIEQSVKNIYSITSPNLMDLKAYKEADIIHFHMFHNTRLSLYSLKKISEEKKIILSLHDPWFITGRCIHFFECQKWRNGCKNCPKLNNLFYFSKDNCNDMWNLKKLIFENIDIDLVVATDWMKKLVKESPITKTQKNIHKIPLGIDYEKFLKVTKEEAKKRYKIKDEVVLFLRAQNEFKGTPYVLEALKMLETEKKITVITCDQKNLLDEVKDKYRIIDLGNIQDDEMIYAMNACDIFLMPSTGESFGMMAIEAMSCSKPVVVFDNSALPSVTKAPECGYLVKNKDSEDLMKAIKFLVENQKEREKRGKLGRKIVEEEYSNEVYNNNLKRLYNKVYERKTKDIKNNISQSDSYNIKQFKLYLNQITVRLFGTENEFGKSLMFEVKKARYKSRYKIKYADLELQEILHEYTTKLYEYLAKNDKAITNEKEIKIQKIKYLIINNPGFVIEKAKNRIITRLKNKIEKRDENV